MNNAIERDNNPYLFPGLLRGGSLLRVALRASKEMPAGRTKTWTEFKVPEEAIGCGFKKGRPRRPVAPWR